MNIRVGILAQITPSFSLSIQQKEHGTFLLLFLTCRLSVDISPDQTKLIFDMLGDIYTLPISGGNALIFKGGVAFDRQVKKNRFNYVLFYKPRFSPDGNYILYTSDESGCDNIWVMEIATRKYWMVIFLEFYFLLLFEVTNETFRFVSNAMWAPDQKSIVATKVRISTKICTQKKKWFTSERSIAAGEIWR